MHVALGQITVTRDKGENLEKLRRMAATAASAGDDLIVFPEGAMVHFGDPDERLAVAAEPIDGAFVRSLREAARENGIAILFGMFEPADGSRVYNTVVALGRDGSVLGYYRKIHLFDAFGHRESDKIQPGPGTTLTFELSDLRLGVMTCYDVRFPELARRLVDEGAQGIVLPAAWVHGLLKEEQWEVMVRARAIENTLYVLAAGQVGNIYSGSSMIVDPMGVVKARAGEEEELLRGEIQRKRVEDVRAKLPSLEHRRFAVSLTRPKE